MPELIGLVLLFGLLSCVIAIQHDNIKASNKLIAVQKELEAEHKKIIIRLLHEAELHGCEDQQLIHLAKKVAATVESNDETEIIV